MTILVRSPQEYCIIEASILSPEPERSPSGLRHPNPFAAQITIDDITGITHDKEYLGIQNRTV